MYASVTALVLSTALALAAPTPPSSEPLGQITVPLLPHPASDAITTPNPAARSPLTHWLVYCNTMNAGDRQYAQDGVSHLSGLKGAPTIGPGPKNCQRVSCSWGTAIYWCNESRAIITVPSWDVIAKSAQAIVDQCPGYKIAGEAVEASGRWKTKIGVGYYPC
ncbi:hypothetical protein MN608_00185 [Microdochium nivale]|nr:hypothetical protein MN608_00185 [Microdochium nivale]